MKDKVFFDTNILLYSLDQTAITKQKIARNLFNKYTAVSEAVISFQVVQEFINVSYKRKNDQTPWHLVQLFLSEILYPLWTINPSIDLYHLAQELKDRHHFSFYDSLIISAALRANCTTLFSEDLQHKQQIDSMVIINPFK